MGTNYYAYPEPPCPHCGRQDEPRHIGKSSVGWCFALHVYPDDGINTLDDWRVLFKDGQIKDEYGRDVSVADMLSCITERGPRDPEKKPYGYDSWATFHRENHSQLGPNGMLRSQIDGDHTVGHGEGTWDYCIGEFS